MRRRMIRPLVPLHASPGRLGAPWKLRASQYLETELKNKFTDLPVVPHNWLWDPQSLDEIHTCVNGFFLAEKRVSV